MTEAGDILNDDSLLRLYNRELIQLSVQAEKPKHLHKADAAAKAVSPICGSEVAVELALKEGRVTGFGYEVEACALTRAVVAVMAKAIIGKNRSEIAAAGAALKEMLENSSPPPVGEWAGLKILQPVADYKARHNAILLPFEAVEKSFKNLAENPSK